VLLGDGQVVVDGPARQVMSESLVFASQINKLFRDPDLLTVEDVLGSQTPDPPLDDDDAEWADALPLAQGPR
jgi:hypothetical protein